MEQALDQRENNMEHASLHIHTIQQKKDGMHWLVFISLVAC